MRFAAWVNRHQLDVIDPLQQENRVLEERLGGRRIRFTDPVPGSTLLTSKEAQPQTKPFELYDSRLPGFTLRIKPSGVRS